MTRTTFNNCVFDLQIPTRQISAYATGTAKAGDIHVSEADLGEPKNNIKILYTNENNIKGIKKYI